MSIKMINFGENVTPADIKKFVVAGNATFTLKSEKTGKHFTYKVREPKDRPDTMWGRIRNPKNTTRFVSVLCDGDKYVYMGIINDLSDGISFRQTLKSNFNTDSPSVKALNYFLNGLNHNQIAHNLHVYHSGKCCRCGRELTDPVSISLGIGPICRDIH